MPFLSSSVSLVLVHPISNTKDATLSTIPRHLFYQATLYSTITTLISATMSTENFVSLDWRSAPSSSKIVERIEKLFTTLDQKGTVSLCLSNSKAKRAICLVEQGGEAMIRRRDNLVSQSASLAALRGT